MKRHMHDTSRLTEFFVKAGLIAALVAAWLAPMTINANGSDDARQFGSALPMMERASWHALPLPPIPYLETMPWLVRERPQKHFKIDMLFAPKFEIPGPAVAATGGDGQTSPTRRAPVIEASKNG